MPGERLFALATLARRGLAKPGRPDRILAQLVALRRWGYTLAGELRASAARHPDRPAIIDEQGSITYGGLVRRTDRLARALSVTAGRAGRRPHRRSCAATTAAWSSS